MSVRLHPTVDFSVPQSLVDQVARIPPLVLPPTRAVFARNEPAAGPFRINSKSGFIGSVEGAALGNGRFVMCWYRFNEGADWKVLCRIFGDDGSPKTTEIVVAQVSEASGAPYPAVAALVDGSFLVSWEVREENDQDSNLFARRYTNAGSPSGDVFQVNSMPAASLGAQSIAGLADGGFVVVWEYFDHTPGVTNDGLYARRFGADTLPLSAEFEVNTIDGELLEWDPEASVVAMPNSGFFVTWTQRMADLWAIMGREYTPAQVGLGVLQLSGSTTSQQDISRAGALGTGGVVVSWNHYNAPPADSVLARFMPTGRFGG